MEDVLRAEQRLFEIQVVHEEQIESHNSQERENSQTGAEASPRAAHIQAEPVNEPAEG